MHCIGRILRAIRLVGISLRPSTNRNGSPLWTAVAVPIITEPVRSGSGGINLFFPDTAPLAAPFLLFRLKRLGYSNCRVLNKSDGLYLFAQR